MKKNLLIASIFASLCICGCDAKKTPSTNPDEPSQTVVAATGITLSSSDVSLIVGETSQLVATVSPTDATDKTVTWSVSEGSEYISVTQNGLVSAIAAGSAVVTAKTNNNLVATCNFTISNTAVLPTGVTLDKTSINLVVGGSETLSATVAPNEATDKTVTWSVSEGSEYVSVSQNGVVSAIAAGSAVVTVKTSNDKTATCNVTVSNTAVLPTGVTLSKDSIDLYVGDSETLTATVSPNDTTDKTLTWSVISGNDVVSITNGTVTGLKEGTATVQVSTSNGKTDTCAVNVETRTIKAYINKDVHSLISGNPFESVNGGQFVEVDNVEYFGDVPYFTFTYGATVKFNLVTKGYFEPTGLLVNNTNIEIQNGAVTFSAVVEDPDDPIFNLFDIEVVFKDNTPKIGDYKIETENSTHITLCYSYENGEATTGCSQNDKIIITPQSSHPDYEVKSITGYTYTTNDIIQHKSYFTITKNNDGTYYFVTPFSHEEIKTIWITVTEVNGSAFKNHPIVGDYAVIRTFSLSGSDSYIKNFEVDSSTSQPTLLTFAGSGEIAYRGGLAYATTAQNGQFTASFSTSSFTGVYGSNILIFGKSSSGDSFITPLSAGSTDLVIAVKLTDGVGAFDITMDNNVFKVDGKTYGLFNFYNKGSLYASCFIDVENRSVIADTTISQYVGTSVNDDKAVFDVIDKDNNKVISFGYQYDGGKDNHVIITDHLNGYTDANHSLVFINNNQAIYDDVLYSVSKDNNNLTLSGATHVASIIIDPSNLTFVVTEEHDVEAKTLNIANLTFVGRSKGGNDLSIVFGPSNTEITGRIIQIDGCAFYWAFTAEFDATNNQLLLTINEVGYYYTYSPQSTHSYSDEGAKKGVKKLFIEDGKLTFIENYSGMSTWDVKDCTVTCAEFHY